MGKGLHDYDQNDEVFKYAVIPRLFITTFFTISWYSFAKYGRVFHSNQTLTKSLPVAAILSFYLSKGVTYHYLAIRHSLAKNRSERKLELENYSRQLGHLTNSH